MQQLFPTHSTSDELRDPHVVNQAFPVPVSLQASVAAQLVDSLQTARNKNPKSAHKRSRTEGDLTSSKSDDNGSETMVSADVSLLKRVVEYGAYYTTVSDAFHRRLTALGHLRRSSTTPTEASTMTAEAAAVELCQYAVRQGLLLISRVVAADTEGLLLRPAVTSTREGKASTSAAAEPTDRLVQRDHDSALRTTVELYCVMQALELELRDTLLFPSDPANARRAPSAVQDRILACVDALEETILEMTLARCRALTRKEHTQSTTATADSLTAFRALLLKLPECFSLADWPSRLVSVSAPPAPPSDRALLLTAGEEAVTAILLRTLTAVKALDACDALHLSSAPPVAALSALALDVPMDLDPEHCSFPLLLGRTWSGVLGTRGVRRAALEAEIFFAFHARDMARKGSLKHTSEVKKSGKSTGATSTTRTGKDRNELTAAHTATELVALRRTFVTSLESAYVHYLAHVASAESVVPEKVSLMSPSTVFSLAHNVLDDAKNTALTDAQQRALRVLERVRAFDTKSWFAVPAFDLVNADFCSLRYYVRGAVFAEKSKRSAFDALRRLFEQMVDKCVAKYGPTHEFSDCISTLRHKLVDAARQEQLL